MTQEELAKEIGITQSTVSRWMTGTTKPTGLAKKVLKEKFPTLYSRIMEIYNERNLRTHSNQ